MSQRASANRPIMDRRFATSFPRGIHVYNNEEEDSIMLNTDTGSHSRAQTFIVQQARRTSENELVENTTETPHCYLATNYGRHHSRECTKEVLSYTIIRVKNPFLFYMVRECDAEKSAAVYKNFGMLDEIINHGYGLEKPQQLVKNHVYMIRNKESDKWHRVRLLDIDHGFGLGRIFYFDHNLGIEHVALKELMEIPKWLRDEPIVTVYRCHLYDVTPKDGSHDWGREATNWFINKIWDTRVWRALVMTWNETEVGTGASFEETYGIVDMGVVLFEDKEDINEASINWRIVEDGYGKCVGVGDLFRFSQEPCFEVPQVSRLEASEIYMDSFPYFAACRLPQVRITYVESSDCIYVQLIHKLEELKAMEHFMARSVATWLDNLDNADARKGVSVLCYYKDEITETLTPARAVITKVYLKTAEVLLVDTGCLSIVSKDRIYLMPPHLSKIPAFVHRVHLYNIRPISSDVDVWTNSQNAAFAQLIKEIQMDPNNSIFAVRHTHDDDEFLTTRTIHQPLVFQKKWTTRQQGSNTVSSPLINNLFNSYGVDLVVGRKNDGKNPVEYESITDLIVSDEVRFRAKLVGKQPMTKKQEYFRAVMKSFEWCL